MRYCAKCGQEIAEGSAFCSHCGAAVGSAPVPVTTPVCNGELEREEREFLDNTHQLLRWEMKAWSIASKAFFIMGIAFAVHFLLCALIMGAGAGTEGAFLAGAIIACGIVYCGIFVGFGIGSKKACEKLPQYLDTVYTDFSLTYNRCGNIGMMIFTAFFSAVPVFFIINFARMKASGATVARIMEKQRLP